MGGACTDYEHYLIHYRFCLGSADEGMAKRESKKRKREPTERLDILRCTGAALHWITCELFPRDELQPQPQPPSGCPERRIHNSPSLQQASRVGDQGGGF